MSAQPNNKDGWGYVYAGARATYGFNSGKIYFEVKFVDNLETKLDKEDTLHDLRVGWSTNDATMQLGGDDKSWCYTSSTGKMVTNKAFEEYGEKFEKGEAVLLALLSKLLLDPECLQGGHRNVVLFSCR